MHRATKVSELTESADGSMTRVTDTRRHCGRHVGLDKGGLLMEVRMQDPGCEGPVGLLADSLPVCAPVSRHLVAPIDRYAPW